MIDFLRGRIVHRETDHVVIEVQGVGYRVFCANPFALPMKENEETILYIHHHVREDAILLYGFSTRDEQMLFRRLLEVSGIGPKVAIGILSGGTPEAVITAIRNEDIGFLTRLPGIGKKTAQRIVFDLKDKLAPVPLGETAALSAISRNGHDLRNNGGNWAEVKLALLALGFSEAEAERARMDVQPQAQEGATVDDLLKLALKVLYKT